MTADLVTTETVAVTYETGLPHFAVGQDVPIYTNAAASAVTQLPEPETIALAVLSLVALAGYRIRTGSAVAMS